MALNPLKLVLPKGKGKKGVSATYDPTFNPFNSLLPRPAYQDHLTALYDSRLANDANSLLENATKHDPDVSAAVHAFLTVGGSADFVIYAYDPQGEVDPDGISLGRQVLESITTTYDYSLGFTAKPTFDGLCQNMRYWLLLRGMITSELVFDKQMIPSELRMMDPTTLWFNETAPGVFDPFQRPRTNSGDIIDLNIPTFNITRFHQSPTDVFSFSPFVSAINTIAARQEVINELYRILRVVGYPRLDFTVLEDVLNANAPVTIRQDPQKLRSFVESEIGKISSSISQIRSDQALVHSSAVQAKVINDKNPGAGIPIDEVVKVLDAQNQAALRVMPAVIGKGNNGQVAGTEARLFALGADALNRCVADALSYHLTLAARLAGYQGKIVSRFLPVELRPALELEPQRVMKASRLKEDLSLGLISDVEYHMEMYGRPPPAGSPPLSGTNFAAATPAGGAASVDVGSITPNSDPLGRSLAPEGGKSAKSNSSKSGSAK